VTPSRPWGASTPSNIADDIAALRALSGTPLDLEPGEGSYVPVDYGDIVVNSDTLDRVLDHIAALERRLESATEALELAEEWIAEHG
jgi:hypothetical protein